MQTADIETKSPEPRTYTQKADSGNEMTRAWCDGCGAGVWLRSASKPGLTFLKAGEFEEDWLVPLCLDGAHSCRFWRYPGLALD